MPFIDDPSIVTQRRAGRHVSVQETMQGAQVGHQAIFDAILAGNPRKAETAARRHIAQTLSEVDKLDDWRSAITAARQHGQS
jgi:DNA-binding GntR family transcriptional regulator